MIPGKNTTTWGTVSPRPADVSPRGSRFEVHQGNALLIPCRRSDIGHFRVGCGRGMAQLGTSYGGCIEIVDAVHKPTWNWAQLASHLVWQHVEYARNSRFICANLSGLIFIMKPSDGLRMNIHTPNRPLAVSTCQKTREEIRRKATPWRQGKALRKP